MIAVIAPVAPATSSNPIPNDAAIGTTSPSLVASSGTDVTPSFTAVKSMLLASSAVSPSF